jgi:hypothetical protein
LEKIAILKRKNGRGRSELPKIKKQKEAEKGGKFFCKAKQTIYIRTPQVQKRNELEKRKKKIFSKRNKSVRPELPNIENVMIQIGGKNIFFKKQKEMY